MIPLTLTQKQKARRSPSISYRKRNWLQRLGWHIQAYVPIIGIAALVGLSLSVIHLHRLISHLFVKESKPISAAQEELEVRGN